MKWCILATIINDPKTTRWKIGGRLSEEDEADAIGLPGINLPLTLEQQRDPMRGTQHHLGSLLNKTDLNLEACTLTIKPDDDPEDQSARSLT